MRLIDQEPKYTKKKDIKAREKSIDKLEPGDIFIVETDGGDLIRYTMQSRSGDKLRGYDDAGKKASIASRFVMNWEAYEPRPDGIFWLFSIKGAVGKFALITEKGRRLVVLSGTIGKAGKTMNRTLKSPRERSLMADMLLQQYESDGYVQRGEPGELKKLLDLKEPDEEISGEYPTYGEDPIARARANMRRESTALIPEERPTPPYGRGFDRRAPRA